jgi:hypothetical protein
MALMNTCVADDPRRNTEGPCALAGPRNDGAGRLIAELMHKYLL